jgi:ABC-type transporter Mla MlaB component
VGIFSLFGKKDGQQLSPVTGHDATRKKTGDTLTPAASKNTLKADTKTADPAQQPTSKRKMDGLATTLKIDEIESEMSSEFIKFAQTGNTQPGPPTISPKQDAAPAIVQPVVAAPTAAAAPETPAIGSTTQFLLSDDTLVGRAALSESETAPAIEEAAILYANGQTDIAEHVLQAAIQEDALGDALPTIWNMLFDLYIVSGKHAQFEHLSIEYANKFETSPPTWIDIGAASPPTGSSNSRATPAVAFSGKLDINIVKQLERVKNLATSHPTLRLEFSRITAVDPVGCGLLLNVLMKVQKSGNDLILVGAHELADKVRTILQVGRRDETEAPWLLLLELLRLLTRESEFEEASIDYCITFEVSPPAYVAPKNKVTTAAEDLAGAKQGTEEFAMPSVIEGNTDQLIHTLITYAESHQPAIVDCSRLKRVDFGAAGHLLTGLAPLAAKGMQVELHNVNYLVIALFNVIGLRDLVHIFPRKA